MKMMQLHKLLKGSWEPQGSLDHTLRTIALYRCIVEYNIAVLYMYCWGGFPLPCHHQVIYFINKFLSIGKKLYFGNTSLLQILKSVHLVTLSTVSSLRQNVHTFLSTFTKNQYNKCIVVNTRMLKLISRGFLRVMNFHPVSKDGRTFPVGKKKKDI